MVSSRTDISSAFALRNSERDDSVTNEVLRSPSETEKDLNIKDFTQDNNGPKELTYENSTSKNACDLDATANKTMS